MFPKKPLVGDEDEGRGGRRGSGSSCNGKERGGATKVRENIPKNYIFLSCSNIHKCF